MYSNERLPKGPIIEAVFSNTKAILQCSMNLRRNEVPDFLFKASTFSHAKSIVTHDNINRFCNNIVNGHTQTGIEIPASGIWH